jgi:hypothetical protein
MEPHLVDHRGPLVGPDILTGPAVPRGAVTLYAVEEQTGMSAGQLHDRIDRDATRPFAVDGRALLELQIKEAVRARTSRPAGPEG